MLDADSPEPSGLEGDEPRGTLMLWQFWALILGGTWWLEWLTIRTADDAGIGFDGAGGVQKFHSHRVSRLGGVGIFVALTTGLLGIAWVSHTETALTAYLIVCMLPVFGIGLVEDLSKEVGVLARLAFTTIGAAIGWWLLGARLTAVDIPVVDSLLAMSSLAALLLTVLAASGMAHAVNIIDGFNGLSGFYGLAASLALAAVGHQVGDSFVTRVALATSASVIGFLLLNYPYGRIFLGDSGAYLLGFVIAELSILLVTRNPKVSPWFPALVTIYPVWETLFSIYRKKCLRGISPAKPDGLHFHMLIHMRLVKARFSDDEQKHELLRNSTTSLYLWLLIALTVGTAVLYWNIRSVLISGVLSFAVSYVWLYWRIVRFRTPTAMVLRSHSLRATRADVPQRSTP